MLRNYTDVELASVEEIRPQLETLFKELSSEDLMVQGIFLVARKPDRQESNQSDNAKKPLDHE